MISITFRDRFDQGRRVSDEKTSCFGPDPQIRRFNPKGRIGRSGGLTGCELVVDYHFAVAHIRGFNPG